jgi:hypothetical protein
LEIIVDGGESAKSLKRPGMAKLLAMVDAGKVQTVIIAKRDRLTRSVKDLCELLERFERRGVALVSVAESLDTGSAAGRLVLNIMAAVSQWEREAIGNVRATPFSTSVPGANGWATSRTAPDSRTTAFTSKTTRVTEPSWLRSGGYANRVPRSAALPPS